MNKFEHTKKAKNLVSKNPQKSLELYKEAWEKWRNEFNEWDGFFLVKAMKESGSYDRKLMKQVYKSFNQSRLVTSQMQWMYYEREVKDCTDKELRQKEETVGKILNVGSQKDFTSNDDDYACPYTKVALIIVDAFDEKGLNNSSEKMLFWLDKLDPKKLSKEPISYNNDEYSSPFEKFYSKRTKALLDTDRHEDCLNDCEIVLNTINKFHNDADIWTKRRMALCKYQLGEADQAIQILEKLLKHPATDKWFVKAEIADCYLSTENYKKTIALGSQAALDGKGYKFKIGLFQTLANAYLEIGKEEIGRYHALLVKSIRAKEEWSTKDEQQQLYDKFEIFDSEVIEYKEILKICKEQWQKEQFADKEKKHGSIKVIHKNGKSGHALDEDGEAYFFPFHEIQSDKPDGKQYGGSKIEFYLKEATDPDGNPDYHATNINITSWKEGESKFAELEEGSIYTGNVQNIAPFGIFVTISEFDIDGLTHKSTLKETDSLELMDTLSDGDTVEVKIREITTKGPDLEILKVV
jgi:tetratricopeptide (TPR) repeat protein